MSTNKTQYCAKCKSPLAVKRLHVVEATCWKCAASMKVAYIYADGELFTPPAFNSEELQLAENARAILRQHKSKTTGETYLANTCGHCNAFIGEFFVHDYCDNEPGEGGILTGYDCYECRFEARETL